MKKIKKRLLLLLTLLLLFGCGILKVPEKTGAISKVTTTATSAAKTAAIVESATTASATTTVKRFTSVTATTPTTRPAPTTKITTTGQSLLIAIDAGHQRYGNSEKEPVGPGAKETKAKVTAGAVGCVSGLPESELNLAVSLKLRDELKSRGYEVLMIRESQDVDISNAKRAQMANNAGAAAFVRIHADSVDNASVKGATALCQTASNPYNGQLYAKSRRLSECIINEMTAETGGRSRGVRETDTMSGINWCMVPVTIVEMGFMSNPEEDTVMATEEYQWKIARGIADGLDAFFSD